MKDKLCVVNFSNSGWYGKGQDRLAESLNKNGHTNYLMFKSYEEIGCQPHHINPYAFKVYSILKAFKMGYKKVLWLDSSCWAVKSLESMEKIVTKDGFFLEHGGERVGSWTNDKTIEYFKTKRDDLMQVPIVVAGVSAFNIDNDLSFKVFMEWKDACDKGMFKGKWTNELGTESADERCRGHRHDLSSLSILAWKYNLPIQAPHTFLHYVYPSVELSKTATIYLQGM